MEDQPAVKTWDLGSSAFWFLLIGLGSAVLFYVRFFVPPAFDPQQWRPQPVQRPAELHRSSLEIRLVVPDPKPNSFSFRTEEGERLYLDTAAIATQADIRFVTVGLGQFGDYYVTYIHFLPEAAARLKATTAAHIGSRLAIIVDQRVLLAPKISSAVGSPAMIEGRFSQADMLNLAQRIAP